MTELGPKARALIDLARHEDNPDAAARARVQDAFRIRLSAGLTAAGTSGGVETAPSGLGSQLAKSLIGPKSALALATVVAAVGAGQALNSRNTAAVAAHSASPPAVVLRDTQTRVDPPPAAPTEAAPAQQGPGASALELEATPVTQEREAGSQQGSSPSAKPEPASSGISEPRERTPARREPARAVRTGRGALDDAPSSATLEGTVAERPSSTRSDAKPAAPRTEALLAEARALREVQQVLRAGNSARALALLAEQEQRFSDGQLGEARAAARAMASCANQSAEGRRSSAAAFEARWPRSILLSSVRAACGPSKE
jgi:hypothetical protein